MNRVKGSIERERVSLGLKRKVLSRFLVQAADDKIAMDFEVVPTDSTYPSAQLTK